MSGCTNVERLQESQRGQLLLIIALLLAATFVALVMPFSRETASEYARRARRRIRRAQWTSDELALPI